MISLEDFQNLNHGQQKRELAHIQKLIYYTDIAEQETKAEIMIQQRKRLEEYYTLLLFIRKGT